MQIYTIKQEDGTEKKYTVNNGNLVEIQEGVDPVKRLTVTVDEGIEMVGLGRSSFMGLLHKGEIKARKVGRRWIIPIAAINEFLGLNA